MMRAHRYNPFEPRANFCNKNICCLCETYKKELPWLFNRLLIDRFFPELYESWKNGEMTLADIDVIVMEEFGRSTHTVIRLK